MEQQLAGNALKGLRNSRQLAAGVYLVLSMLSGFTELGALTYAVLQHWPLCAVLAIGCAYQTGALALSFVRLSPRRSIALVFAAFAVIIVGTGAWTLGAAVLLLSAGLQGLREEASSVQSVGTLAKRASRIVGFAIAGSFGLSSAAVVALAAAAAGILVTDWQLGTHIAERRGIQAPRTIDLIMVIHQAHYFLYAYALPYLFLRVYGMGATSAALVFALGWISYAATPVLLGRLAPIPTLIAGHLGVSCILLTIPSIQRIDMLIAAWFATGFGGGTVFAIRQLEKSSRPSRGPAQLDTWENIGHVCGASVAIVLSILFATPAPLFVAASLVAATTAGMVAITAAITRRRARTV